MDKLGLLANCPLISVPEAAELQHHAAAPLAETSMNGDATALPPITTSSSRRRAGRSSTTAMGGCQAWGVVPFCPS